MTINTTTVNINQKSGSTLMKVNCNDIGGSLISSLFFSIQIKCGPNSVIISPSSNFK